MNAYHEYIRENISLPEIQRNKYVKFLPHFHNTIEILVANTSGHTIILNGNTYKLEEGSIVFFDSYDFHGYEDCINKNRDDCVIIIPYLYAKRFNLLRKNMRTSTPILVNKKICASILEIVDRLIIPSTDINIKTCGYDLILAIINANFNFSLQSTETENDLIRKILQHIKDNFNKEISLTLISKSLGYTEAHISRTFHKYMKTSIPKYINHLRLKYANKLISENPQLKITQVIFDSGFKSIQSYYRNKIESET